MRSLIGCVIALSVTLSGAAIAIEMTSFQGTLQEVSQDPDCKSADYSDFTLFNCQQQLVLWYFTKPNHPAHPGVIKRIVYQEKDGAWYAREDGRSFASDAAQPAFKAWLAQITDLDRQMREDIEKQKSGAEK